LGGLLRILRAFFLAKWLGPQAFGTWTSVHIFSNYSPLSGWGTQSDLRRRAEPPDRPPCPSFWKITPRITVLWLYLAGSGNRRRHLTQFSKQPPSRHVSYQKLTDTGLRGVPYQVTL
jgi:hypothetical protein